MECFLPKIFFCIVFQNVGNTIQHFLLYVASFLIQLSLLKYRVCLCRDSPWILVWILDIPDLPTIKTAEATCLGKWDHYFSPKNNVCYLQKCRTVSELIRSFICFRLQKSNFQIFMNFKKTLKCWEKKSAEKSWPTKMSNWQLL